MSILEFPTRIIIKFFLQPITKIVFAPGRFPKKILNKMYDRKECCIQGGGDFSSPPQGLFPPPFRIQNSQNVENKIHFGRFFHPFHISLFFSFLIFPLLQILGRRIKNLAEGEKKAMLPLTPSPRKRL